MIKLTRILHEGFGIQSGAGKAAWTIACRVIALAVLLKGDIAMFRVKQMIQDKTQTANNGLSLLRAVTPYWVICLAPFGRAGKRSFAVLRLWARTCHCRRDVPSAQPLPNSLNS